jgi:hypothetical protein
VTNMASLGKCFVDGGIDSARERGLKGKALESRAHAVKRFPLITRARESDFAERRRCRFDPLLRER